MKTKTVIRLVLMCSTLLVAVGCHSPCGVTSPSSDIDTVLFLLVDSMRQDHIGAYGYNRSLTPEIDRLSKGSTLFRNAVAQSSWTKPTVVSLLSGLYPRTHLMSGIYDRLDPDIVLFPAALQRAGFLTFAFSANSLIVPEAGFSQGFSAFEYQNLLLQKADVVNQSLYKVMDRVPRNERVCVYVHYMDPHFPYLPDKPVFSRKKRVVFDLEFFGGDKHLNYIGSAERRQYLLTQLINAYDDGIRSNDRMIGQLLNYFRLSGRLKNALIVLIADHGEELLDHQGLTHGQTLYDEVVRIPFFMRMPGQKAETTAELVEQVDICPTLLGLLKIKPPAKVEGRNIFADQVKKQAYSELALNNRQLSSIRSLDQKLITATQLWQPEDTIRWFRQSAEIPDVSGKRFSFEIMSFHRPRPIDIFENGSFTTQITIPPYWVPVELPLSSHSSCTITLRAQGDCLSPFELGLGKDTRCLAFCLRNSGDLTIDTTREHFSQFYDLVNDPGESADMVGQQTIAGNVASFARELNDYNAQAGKQFRRHHLKSTDEMQEQLRLLGYIE